MALYTTASVPVVINHIHADKKVMSSTKLRVSFVCQFNLERITVFIFLSIKKCQEKVVK